MVLVDGIQCCVLGCTHYPLVIDSIRKLYPDLSLIDPAQQMALELKGYLERENLERSSAVPGRLSIYTTGDVEEYALRAQQTGLERVDMVTPYPAMEI